MGNKLGRRRQLMDEKYTRPQGLFQHKDVDHKKLRKLILESKLVPCYPGDDDCSCDLEECPICFLEEQRVIEAKIRLRQQEIQNEEERMLKRQEMSLSGRVIEPATSSFEGEDIVSVPNPSTIRRPSCNREIRDDEFDPDPENIMLMEVIWLSFNFRRITSTDTSTNVITLIMVMLPN